jgi:hypothetical protein
MTTMLRPLKDVPVSLVFPKPRPHERTERDDAYDGTARGTILQRLFGDRL